MRAAQAGRHSLLPPTGHSIALGAGHWAESSRIMDGRRTGAAGSAHCRVTPGQGIPCYSSHARQRQQRSAVDTVVQQRSRAPRGNRETRAPSLKVAKPLSAGLAHGLAGQSEGAAVGLHKACRADDTTTPPPPPQEVRECSRELAKLPSSGRTRRDLPLNGCSTASPLPGGERQVPGDVQSPHACVWRQRVVCSSPGVVYSWQGRGWGTCSSSIVTSKPSPMGSSTAPGV